MKYASTMTLRKIEQILLREFRKRMLGESVIFAKLTDEEYKRFQDGHISYSGATGMGVRPEDYNGVGPYIASFIMEIPKALRALRWKRVTVKREGNTWILSRA
jgi:hypothetical protein